MRIMVTGATAPLGAAIVDRLLAEPEAEVGLVVAVGREPEARWRDPRVRYYQTDLTRTRAVRDLIQGPLRTLAVDTVIHTAQHRDPHDVGRRVHAQNVDAARALVLGCADHATIRRFVHRSFAEVYAQPHATTTLIDEDAPLELDPSAPQWLRDRVEADLTVASHQGGALQITVLRCAELLVPGGQLWDYLSSGICLRPAGFDPIVNVLSLDDACAAFVCAARASRAGVFNIPGADVLPLSRAIAESDRLDIPVADLVMAPLYRLRRAVAAGREFRYDLNAKRFHVGSVLDGARAARDLGYAPRTPVSWPRPWWRVLLERLAEAQR
jgi:UDP-glucose 4-epimerase